MTMQTQSFTLSECDMKELIRHSLLVAGHELGEEGDHWPVVKNTITDCMRDWENLEIERAVQSELKTHFYAHLSAMEELLKTCDADMQAEIGPRLKQLRDIYDAAFTEPAENVIDMTRYLEEVEEDDNPPIHLKRAEAILDVLFDDQAAGGVL